MATTANTLTKLLLAPWEYYRRITAFTFTAVVGSNFGTSVYDPNRRALMMQHPSTVTAAIVAKGLLLAPIWPAWYMTMAVRPKSAFYLGDSLVSSVISVINEMTPKPTVIYEDNGRLKEVTVALSMPPSPKGTGSSL